jgi:tetratricopeptide (TPR) repeat protein
MDDLHPENPFWKMTVGAGLAALGTASGDVAHFEEAEVYFAEAERLAPYDRRAPLQYGLMLNRWGAATRDGLKYCQAIDLLNRSINLRRDADAYKGLGAALAATGHVDEALAALEEAREFGPPNSQTEPDKEIPKMIERTKKLKARKIKVINCA